MYPLIANSDIIEKFLKATNLSYYKISKDTKINERTIASLSQHTLNIENITFKTASILTAYAKSQK